jgi:SMODS and SLOG-associating 2TM effector domain 1
VTTREQQFVEVYRTARVEDQRRYYERAASGFEAAHRQLLLGSAVLFGISGTVAILSGLEIPGKLVWATLAAVLPAITTAIAAYEGLFAFQRVAKVFRDAARNVRRIQPPAVEDTAAAQAALEAYVAEVEQVFERERGQWGQLGAEPDAQR